jgi:hypothetical protein
MKKLLTKNILDDNKKLILFIPANKVSSEKEREKEIEKKQPERRSEQKNST